MDENSHLFLIHIFNGIDLCFELLNLKFESRRNIMENIMKFFKKHSKKKTILILSTIFSGIITFIWLLSK